MAKQDREFKDVYWLRLVEVTDTGLRVTLKREVTESLGVALKHYDEWILEHEKVTDKKLLVDILYIHEGQFFTMREHHCFSRHECEVSENVMRVEW